MDGPGQLRGIYDDVKAGVSTYLRSGSHAAENSLWRNTGSQYVNSYFRPGWLKVTSEAPGPTLEGALSNKHAINIGFGGEVLSADPALNLGIAVYTNEGQLLFWSTFRDAVDTASRILEPGYTEMRAAYRPGC